MHDAIASGGMATVHYGVMRGPRGFSRAVAIKRLHPELASDADLRESLAAEARLSARIRHPNVVAVLDVVEHERDVFLVMELVSAVSLAVLLRRAREANQKLPPAVAVAIVSSILRGLAVAHELGVVHRDVSPQNVLVGADGVPKLVDFGIAKLESQGTRGVSLKGKPSYMAPEQLRGEPVDRRADLYSSAVLLWELLTGSRLFSGDSDHAVMLKVLERRVDAPGRIVAGLPRELDRVTLKGLARDRDARYANATSMAAELESAVAPASASDVGALVVALCRDELTELDRRAASLALDTRGSAPPRGWGKRAAWALAALSALAFATLLVRRERAERDAPGRPASSPASSPVAAPPPPPPASTPSGAASGTPSAAPAPERPVVSQKPAKKPPDCDPPYVVDSEGFQRMKPECL